MSAYNPSVTASGPYASTLPGGRAQQTERFNAVPDTVLTDTPGMAHPTWGGSAASTSSSGSPGGRPDFLRMPGLA